MKGKKKGQLNTPGYHFLRYWVKILKNKKNSKTDVLNAHFPKKFIFGDLPVSNILTYQKKQKLFGIFSPNSNV